MTTTATREERRAKIKARYDRLHEEAQKSATSGSEEEITSAVRKTNLMYLWNQKPQPYALTSDCEVDVHHESTSFKAKLPAGTKGWLYVEKAHSYDKYVWIDDEQYPAKDAKIVQTKTYYTWACLVQVEGKIC